MALAAPAEAQTRGGVAVPLASGDVLTARRFEPPKPWDDGLILHQSEERTVWMDGRSAQHFGAFSIFNDGTMAPRLLDRTLFANGRSCANHGNVTFCE